MPKIMSSQIKNLKSRTNKEKIKHLAILFFSLFLTLAVFSQINAAKPKPTSDVGLKKADWLYYKSNNDLSAYLGKKSSSLPTVRYQKGGDYLEFSMTGVSSTTSVSLETDVKTPNNPTLFYRNILDGVDANYQITNIPFRVKEEIVLKNQNLKIKNQNDNEKLKNSENLTFIFSAETSAKPVKQSDGSIAFFDNQNNYLFQLDKPFMIDAKGNRSEKVSVDITHIEKTKPSQINNAFNFQLPIINFQSMPNDLIFKRFEKLKISKFIENWPLKIENSNKQYQIILKADSDWLNSTDRVYPIVIDPTVTHNADANFTGQMNRIADSDSTTSTQLESSYPEATKDPYTVLLLHFNEANGTQTGIRDYASTTRVITANGHASTTNYVTQLGMGNSLALDGSGDWLTLPSSPEWNFEGDFSIDFWYYAKTISTYKTILEARSASDANPWAVTFTPTNFLYFFSAGDYNLGSSNDIVANTWAHWTITRSGSVLRGYKNGILTGSATLAGAITRSGTTLRIGTDITDGNGVNGRLDDLRILKGRALTPEEIKAAASRRPYAVYTSPVVDATASVAWNTLNWTEGGVATGNGEQPYSTSSLVAQWDFNDTSGATLTASSSGSCTTACNGTLTNFAYTASQDQATTTTGWTNNNKKWGAGALMLESAAAADYVSISDPASNVLDPNSADLTIETWIKTNDTSAEIFSNNNANGTACANNGYYLGIDANGYPVFYLDTNGATAGCDASITSQFKINDGNWHKVSVSATRGTSAIIYVDGKSAGSDTSVTSYSAITVTGNAFFGGSAGGLDAILDSTRYYSRALSASEILSNYNAGNIEIQTRTGATSDPNDGTWEAWKPITGETQLFSLDSDAANWRSDIMASTTIATSTETTLKMEGTGSLKIRTGMASTTANTVALWHFEETGTTTGTYLYDETANNNDATTTGTTVADGIFGKGRKFNGTSDYVSVADSADWSFGTGDFSIDFWLKTSYGGAATQVLAAHGNEIAWSNIGWQINNMNTSSGVAQCKYSNNGGVGLELDGTKGIRDGVWHHVACVREGNSFKLYVDGKQDVSTTQSITILDSASIVTIGTQDDFAKKLNGDLDEFRVTKGRALSADEIAETYRMGANHHLTRQVSATDLSAQTKLAFNVAADRPGTYLDAMLGESDYANYELASSTLALSTTTVLYIKGDEIASSTSIKDSSFSGKAITANGNARTAGNGKIGNSVYFDGSGDYLTTSASSDWAFGTGDFSMDMWVYLNSLPTPGNIKIFLGNGSGNPDEWFAGITDTAGTKRLYFQAGSTQRYADQPLVTGSWHHYAWIRLSGTLNSYFDGNLIGSQSTTDSLNNTTAIDIGRRNDGVGSIDGYLDELRILKGTALSADQIRQAYEYGLRSHQITIDFGATLQTSDLISSATDYNFTLTATTSGLSATTSGLYLGDKIIIKENLGGTEYSAQGTVNAINTTTGAITVPSWDSGSSFPSGGFTQFATVFKWQREYFDLGGAATTTRDAITNITLRPTNGAEGRTIYLDDFRYNTNYLTASSSSAITSGNNRYLQYRAIFTSTDTFVSPYLSAINTLYTSLATMFPPAIGVSGGGFLSF